MGEVNLLDQYPRSQRSFDDRAQQVTDEIRKVSRQFGKEYFDGSRLYGYGGYNYHPRFWQATVKRMRDYYRLSPEASILDVGCAKGFMLHDWQELLPAATLAGIDVSEYALANSLKSVQPFLRLGNARKLPFPDRSFDLVLAINTVHNLPLEECKQALREIARVSRKHAFVVVDAWRTPEEKMRLEKWVLTCQTAMHVQDWKRLFEEVGYRGDYYWFIAE